MGLFGALFSGGPRRVKADYEVFSKYLDGGGLMDRVSELILTPEKRETYAQAAGITQRFLDEYGDYDKEGGLNQASLAASRSDIFRTGAAAALGRGRYSANELAQGMSQMRFAGMAQAEQSKAALRSAIGMGIQYQIAAAGQMDLSSSVNTILSGAAGLEQTRMQTNAQLEAAHMAMQGKLLGGLTMGFAPLAGAGLAAGFSSMTFPETIQAMYG